MISIRPCNEKDFAEVFYLLEQLWPDRPLNFDRMLAVFNAGLVSMNQIFICAEIEGNIVGFCSLTIKNSLWQQGRIGHVDELIVDEDYRGTGAGSMLLSDAIEMADELGCSRIELDSAFHREDAHRFYASRGFENRAYLFSKALS